MQLTILCAVGFDLFDEDKFCRWIKSHTPDIDDGRFVDLITITVVVRALRDIIGRIEHGVFG